MRKAFTVLYSMYVLVSADSYKDIVYYSIIFGHNSCELVNAIELFKRFSINNDVAFCSCAKTLFSLSISLKYRPNNFKPKHKTLFEKFLRIENGFELQY